MLETFTAHVQGMDVKDRREAALGFMFMQIDTLARRGLNLPMPPMIKPVPYVQAFMERYGTDEIREFKPTITAPKRT